MSFLDNEIAPQTLDAPEDIGLVIKKNHYHFLVPSLYALSSSGDSTPLTLRGNEDFLLV